MTAVNLQGGKNACITAFLINQKSEGRSGKLVNAYTCWQLWLLTATFEDLSISWKGTREVKRLNNQCNNKLLGKADEKHRSHSFFNQQIVMWTRSSVLGRRSKDKNFTIYCNSEQIGSPQWFFYALQTESRFLSNQTPSAETTIFQSVFHELLTLIFKKSVPW